MKYQAEYADENFAIFEADSDNEALDEAWSMEKEHGSLFNLFEIDEDYEEIRTIL